MGFMSTMSSIAGYGKRKTMSAEAPEPPESIAKPTSTFGKVKKAFNTVSTYGKARRPERPY